MFESPNPPSTLIYIFGGSGDLSYRKLIPALYNLFLDGRLPKQFTVFGLGRTEYSDEQFREHVQKGIDTFSRRKRKEDESWEVFSAMIQYLKIDISDVSNFEAITNSIHKKEAEFGNKPAVIFYLAVAPQLVPTILENMRVLPACVDRKNTRIVVEKPFGFDLASAQELNRQLSLQFQEEQIFRIDHYLGKETVQNILAFRFANALFEPVWNKNYIDHIQITAAETVGMEKRGDYYERSGALRDMVQNHLLQLLCMIAMEPPISLDSHDIRNKKADVLHAIRRFTPENVSESAVRGQYSDGKMGDEQKPGYREEEKVAADSKVETFAAAKIFVDNWRWQDVPFYIRTGKRMNAKSTVISVIFRAAPAYSFPVQPAENRMPNRITFAIQPEADIRLRFQAKKPGSTILDPVNMVFTYKDAFKEEPEAYETLLLDVMEGDATLFMRTDQVEAAWKVIMPILDTWTNETPKDFPNYSPGSWGPTAGLDLIERDGRRWITLPLPSKKEETNQ